MERESLDPITLNWMSSSNAVFRAQGTNEKGRWKESKSQRRWKTPGVQGPLNQLIKANMSSQRLKKQRIYKGL